MDLNASELVARTKSTRESLHKGGRPSAASTEGAGAFGAGPPLWIPFVKAFSRRFRACDKLRSIKIHQIPLKSIEIH